MPKALSPDLRLRVHDAATTSTAPATAQRFQVSKTTVHRLRALVRNTGSLAPKPHGGGRERLIKEDDRPRFEAYLAEDVSMRHEDMATRFSAETGRTVSRQTVQRQLSRWGITRKKS